MAQQARELQAELGDNPPADSIAQAAVCAAPIVAAAPPNRRAAFDWLYPQLREWEQVALDRASVLSTQYSVLPTHSRSSHLYDAFLQHYSRNSRKRRGVFFTPQPIANYIV